MKRILTTICILAAAMSANAQEAFKHLSVGLEAGTTGFGVELALPIATDHLVLTAGYNFPSFSVNAGIPFSTSKIKNVIDNANSTLQAAGISDRINDTFSQETTLDANFGLNFGAAKAMLEFYPMKNSSIHLVAGVYCGTGDFISAEGMTDKNFWNSVKSAQADVNSAYDKYKDDPKVSGIDHDVLGKLKANIDGKTYTFKEKDGCAALDAQIAVANIRPYVGVGIGRSIPESRFSIQTDLGVWFHGKPSLQSSNETTYDPSAVTVDLGSAMEIAEKISVWPQLSFRLIYSIF